MEIPPYPQLSNRAERRGDFEVPPRTPLGTSSWKKLQELQSFTAKGTRKRSTCRHEPPLRVPFAVKFLESLEPSPKEGSKRGLGRRPKVFPSGSKRGLGRRHKVFALSLNQWVQRKFGKGVFFLGDVWYNRGYYRWEHRNEVMD